MMVCQINGTRAIKNAALLVFAKKIWEAKLMLYVVESKKNDKLYTMHKKQETVKEKVN